MGLICATVIALIGGLMFSHTHAWRRRAVVRWSMVSLAAALLPATALVYGLANDDFSIAFVYQNSSTHLPVWYKATALWGGHEGSMLLWVLIAAWITRNLALSAADTRPGRRAVGILALLSGGYCLYTLTASSPFDLMLPFAPAQGRDLNPLLQDITFLIHPPLLYAGYLTALVPAALLAGAAYEKETPTPKLYALVRRWTLISWVLLSLGIALGSWWAYRELGWGGFWFWDPVETASFIPWLTLTALLHLLRQGPSTLATVLTYATAVTTGTAALMGAFLVRSGALVSVHAFTDDPTRGLALLAVILLFNAIALRGWMKFSSAQGNDDTPANDTSKPRIHTALEFQAYAMLVTAALITLGLLYPISHELITDIPLTIGAGFYGMFFPPLAFMVAICAGPVLVLVAASKTNPRLPWIVGVTALLAMLLAALIYDRAPWSVAPLSVLCGVWVMLWAGAHLRNNWIANKRTPRALASGIAHFGFGLAMLGAGAASSAGTEIEARMSQGTTVQIEGTDVELVDHSATATAHYHEDLLTLEFKDDNLNADVLQVPRRYYPIRRIETAEATVASSIFGDVYASVGRRFDDGSWGVRLQYRPLIWALWLGIVIACLGGICAVRGMNPRKS